MTLVFLYSRRYKILNFYHFTFFCWQSSFLFFIFLFLIFLFHIFFFFICLIKKKKRTKKRYCKTTIGYSIAEIKKKKKRNGRRFLSTQAISPKIVKIKQNMKSTFPRSPPNPSTLLIFPSPLPSYIFFPFRKNRKILSESVQNKRRKVEG